MTLTIWQLNNLCMSNQKCRYMNYMLFKHCIFSNFIKPSCSVKDICSCFLCCSCFSFFPKYRSVSYNSFYNELLHSSKMYYSLIFIKVEGLLLLLVWQLKNSEDRWKKKQKQNKNYWCAFPTVSSMLQE